MTLKYLANIRSKRGADVIIRCLAVVLAAIRTYAAASSCAVLPTILPGGNPVEARLLAAPVPRVREVIADAMQASAVLLFKVNDQSVAGERTPERIKALGLLAGDEAIRATLTASSQDGAGTRVRVETMRRENKPGVPKHAWSLAVLDQATCLLSLLSLDDPLHRPTLPLAATREVQVPDSMSVTLRARRFFFNTEIKPNLEVPFETAADIVVGDSTAIPKGSLAVASFDGASDVKGFGRGAKGQLRFKHLVLPDGTRLPLRGIVDLQGKSVSKTRLTASAVAIDAALGAASGIAGVASIMGQGFAILAGTAFSAELDGAQTFHVSQGPSLPLR
jgi:hypothetical protein